MAPGDSGEHVFTIKNTGEAPLILQQGQTSCKCTVSQFGGENVAQPASPSEENNHGAQASSTPARVTVDPGKTAEIKLNWKTERPTESFGQAATFYTNDPQNKVVKVLINGEVSEEIALAPMEVWNVGILPENEPVSITGHLYSRVVDQFAIQKIETSHELIKVEQTPVGEEELARHAAKAGYAIKVTVTPGMPIGRMEESLSVTALVRDQEKKVEVPLIAHRPGPYHILPAPGVVWRPEHSVIDFATINAKTQNTFSLPFFVRNFNEGEFKMLGYESDVPDLKVRLEAESDEAAEGKQRHRLVFEFPVDRPLNRSAPPFATLTVKTNHPDAPELKLFLKFLSL
jgi:hypothetical protein